MFFIYAAPTKKTTARLRVKKSLQTSAGSATGCEDSTGSQPSNVVSTGSSSVVVRRQSGRMRARKADE